MSRYTSCSYMALSTLFQSDQIGGIVRINCDCELGQLAQQARTYPSELLGLPGKNGEKNYKHIS